MILTFVGFGELAGAWARALAGRSDVDVRVYARRRPGGASADELSARAREVGVELHSDAAGALRGADVAVACVPSEAAALTGETCIDLLAPGALYVDPTAADPETKRRLAARAAEHDVLFADAALLGTVVVSGIELPTIAAGTGAERWAQIGTGLGMRITAIGGEAGTAAEIKLIRSVYMKGRDALVLEMLLAARRLGIEREVTESIGGAGEQVAFGALADRVMGALAVHAGRRADELAGSADRLAAVGVEPIVTAAAEARLRWMAATGVGARLGRRTDSAAAVLDALEGGTGP